MNLKGSIWYVRKHKGFSQKQLSKVAGVSLKQIKNIESGRTKNPGIETIKRLARVLNVDPSIFFETRKSSVDRALILSERKFSEQSIGIEPILVPGLLLSSRRGTEDDLKPHPRTLEAWVKLGDMADAQGEWDGALRSYVEAVKLARNPFDECRILLEKVSQMHINKMNLAAASDICKRIDKDLNIFVEHKEERDFIKALISNQRGWVLDHKGNYAWALGQFEESLPVAKKLGVRRLESTDHHFMGRAVLEQYWPRFYPELSEISSRECAVRISPQWALAQIRKGQILNDNKSSIGFGKLRESEGVLLLGDIKLARDLLNESRDLLGSTVLAKYYPLIEIQRINTLTTEQDKRDYLDIASAADEILQGMSRVPNPYTFAYARGLVVLLCAQYGAGAYRVDKVERRKMVDLCILSLLLHFEPKHELFEVSEALLSRFVDAMTAREFTDYEADLCNRIEDNADEFEVLSKFKRLPTTALAYAAREIIKRTGERQKKIPITI